MLQAIIDRNWSAVTFVDNECSILMTKPIARKDILLKFIEYIGRFTIENYSKSAWAFYVLWRNSFWVVGSEWVLEEISM